jgi:hypothetical protein
MTERTLDIWTVYDHPRDFPHSYVARLFVVGPNIVTRTEQFMISADLALIREQLAVRGLTRLSPMEGDDPVILETWL